jgi:hypothetical protein
MTKQTSAFGREISWADIDEASRPTTPWGRLNEALDPTRPTEKDFLEVGLCEDDAKYALDGLTQGHYLSFEDACLSTAIFEAGRTKNGTTSLNQAEMRKRARRFVRGLKEA